MADAVGDKQLPAALRGDCRATALAVMGLKHRFSYLLCRYNYPPHLAVIKYLTEI
jgi:hypothetical protein